MFIVLLTLSLAAAFFRGHNKLIERTATALITLAALNIAAWVTAQTGTPTAARYTVSGVIQTLAGWADFLAAYLMVAAEAGMVGYLTWQLQLATRQVWMSRLTQTKDKAEDKQSEAISILGLQLDQTRRELADCRTRNRDLADDLDYARAQLSSAQYKVKNLEAELQQARRRAAWNSTGSSLSRKEVKEIIFHLHPDRTRSQASETLMSRLTELVRDSV